jgi:hypothetical protein
MKDCFTALIFFCLVAFCAPSSALAIVDSLPPSLDILEDTEEGDEDFSLYDDLDFVDGNAKRFCSPKIFDLSPQRFLSVAFDFQTPYQMRLSPLGAYDAGENVYEAEDARMNFTGGLRVFTNIPVLSKNSIVWQLGFNFMDLRYRRQSVSAEEGATGLSQILDENGLRSFGLHSTVFKPLNEKHFLIFQAQADYSGDYSFSNMQSPRFIRYSAAAIWGQRLNDYLQWGVGFARTYRVGELNYLPVLMLNYTSRNRKNGTEILFPAKAYYRRTFSPRSILLAGYDLEGQSYRIQDLSTADKSFEIRRGELRIKAEYQRQIKGFVYFSAQAGYRYDYSFNVDLLDNNGRDFFRGFFGKQQYGMLNQLGGSVFFNFGIHLVSL